MNQKNLDNLPGRIQNTARMLPSGEICWPFEVASMAINAIADSGQVILGIDIREHDEAGNSLFDFTSSTAGTFLEAVDAVEIGRSHALASLNRPIGNRYLLSGSWVLISFVEANQEDEEAGPLTKEGNPTCRL